MPPFDVPPVGSELCKQVRNKLSISQEKLAQLVGVSLRTISRYEAGAAEVDVRLEGVLRRMLQVIDLLSKYNLNQRQIVEFLNTPLERYDYNTLLDLIPSRFATGHFLRSPENELSQLVRHLA
jgi:transcriptional regulator with XRE-family HTH domain